jgi:hypothetical protein
MTGSPETIEKPKVGVSGRPEFYGRHLTANPGGIARDSTRGNNE